MSSPLVSVGIPTHNRPRLLQHALDSVADQDYPHLEVIVSDNASLGPETQRVVESFRDRIPNLRYHRHETNIGPLANFRFLLAEAQGDYFMWLADDDRISPNYVSALASQVAADPGAACAMGQRVLMLDEQHGVRVPTSQFRSPAPLTRAVRYIWRTDDAFLYALHRIEILRQARFDGYWWPNARLISNWAYVYLLDVVLRGRVILVSQGFPEFFHHNYTAKSYVHPSASVRDVPGRAIRRVNVHALYWRKCAAILGPASLVAVVPVSMASLCREVMAFVARVAARQAKRWRQGLSS